jgi:hypothetical protein
MKKQIANPTHRLFIRLIDKTKPVEVDKEGKRWASTVWKEVKEANLGSVKVPNKEIIQFRFEPIDLEEDRDNPKQVSMDDIFKRFLGK